MSQAAPGPIQCSALTPCHTPFSPDHINPNFILLKKGELIIKMKDELKIFDQEKNFFREKKKVINERNGSSSTRWPNKTIPYFYEKQFRN